MTKVAFIVPSTTNKREWSSVKDTYLFNILMSELHNKPPIDCDITLFVGYNIDDKIYSIMEERMTCNAIFDNFKIEWIPFNDEYKGKPTHIWNELAKVALHKGFEYMKVLGDDITLPNDAYWLTSFINKLKKNNNIGFVAGYSNNDQIPTQFLVHKTHLDIFECVYPHEIANWGCDNWMYDIYPTKYGLWLKNYNLFNVGGSPRYDIVWNEKYINAIVKRYKPRFNRLDFYRLKINK